MWHSCFLDVESALMRILCFLCGRKIHQNQKIVYLCNINFKKYNEAMLNLTFILWTEQKQALVPRMLDLIVRGLGGNLSQNWLILKGMTQMHLSVESVTCFQSPQTEARPGRMQTVGRCRHVKELRPEPGKTSGCWDNVKRQTLFFLLNSGPPWGSCSTYQNNII